MTTEELIEKLKLHDPSGKAPVYLATGEEVKDADWASDREGEFVMLFVE